MCWLVVYTVYIIIITTSQVNNPQIMNIISFVLLGAASTRVLQEWAVIVIIVLGVVVLMVIAILIAAVACTCLRRSK